jgi:hypothetical protein
LESFGDVRLVNAGILSGGAEKGEQRRLISGSLCQLLRGVREGVVTDHVGALKKCAPLSDVVLLVSSLEVLCELRGIHVLGRLRA